MYKTILIPLDGSDTAASILAHVEAFARAYHARLVLLTVGPVLPTSIPRAPDIQLTLTFQAEAYLDRVRTKLETQGYEVHTTVCIGEPAVEILAAAKRHNADLIIINSRGGEGAPSPFLGSVAAKVAGASSVPVFVLHTTPAGEGR
jgi:nucleotide-binding universal stress UspA family protein